MDTLEQTALALLLRSPRLSVSTVLELLDIGDNEFRRLLKRNHKIAALIGARKAGTLRAPTATIKTCPSCGEDFLPYASARCCSDICSQIHQVRSTSRAARR